MKALQRTRAYFFAAVLIFAVCPARVQAQSPGEAKPEALAAPRDGQHDFDFEFGT